MGKQITRIAVPDPTVTPLPITAQSVPMNRASCQVTPIALEDYGFVEEEYLLSGLANVYTWVDGQYWPDIRSEDCPYCTRILVRKPADPAAFSGHVLVEMMHGGSQMDNPGTGWCNCFEEILESGDAFVGVSVSATTFPALQRFDPVRYAPLALPNPLPPEQRGPQGNCAQSPDQLTKNGGVPLPDFPETEKGLDFDAMSQLAAMCKRGLPGTPFAGYAVKGVYLSGITFGEIPAYVAAIHPFATLDGTRPVFDGYIIYMSGRAANLNRELGSLDWDDPRATCNLDVPVIRIQTAGDLMDTPGHPFWAMMWRSENSDEPGKLGRWYEVAGSSLRFSGRSDVCALPGEAESAAVGLPAAKLPPQPMLRFDMMAHVIQAAYANLKTWTEHGIPAPMTSYIEIEGAYPSAHFVTDAYGNQQGGYRSPYVDVPIAVYEDTGVITPLPAATIRSLYASRADWLAQVKACCDRMAADRLLTARSAAQLYATFEQIDWAQLTDT